MRQAPESLIRLIEPVVEGLGYECVGVELQVHAKRSLLRIYIDQPAGITLDDCSKVSHQISGVLEVEAPISGDYRLEISSPGLDRPFFKLAQFEKYLGSMIKLQLWQAVNQRKRFTGRLLAVEAGRLRLTEGEQTHEIPFEMITKARLVPDYLIDNGVAHGK